MTCYDIMIAGLVFGPGLKKDAINTDRNATKHSLTAAEWTCFMIFM